MLLSAARFVEILLPYSKHPSLGCGFVGIFVVHWIVSSEPSLSE